MTKTRISILLFLISIANVMAQNLKISEVMFHANSVSDTGNEYIELSGTANSTIAAGTYFIVLSGESSGNFGFVRAFVDLGGRTIGSNGYLVLLQQGNGYTVDPNASQSTGVGTQWGNITDNGLNFTNETNSYLLISSPDVPLGGISYDNNGDGIIDATLNTNGNPAINWTFLDGVGNLDGDVGDIAYGLINFSPNGNGVASNTIVNTGGFVPGYLARTGSSVGSTAADWVAARIVGTDASSFTLGFTITTPASLAGNSLNHVGSINPGANLSSQPPQFDAFNGSLASLYASQEAEISFNDLIVSGNETDDGTVQAFTVTSQQSGTLKLGASAAIATPFVSGTNDQINAGTNAYWTPDGGIFGNDLDAFSVVAKDDDGLESLIPVTVTADVVELFLSEILIHMPDVADINNEYVEFRGTPGAVIPEDTYFVTVSGNVNPGEVFHSFDLGGRTIGTNGYLVLLQVANSYSTPAGATRVVEAGSRWSTLGGNDLLFENNRAFSYLLVSSGSAPAVSADFDSNDDGILDGVAASWQIIDGVASAAVVVSDLVYAPINFLPNGVGTATSGTTINIGAFLPNYFARTKDAVGYTEEDWLVGVVDGTTSATFNLESGQTAPLVVGSTKLDHIGDANLEFIYWDGLTNTIWSDVGNWRGGQVPGASDLVILKSATNPVVTGNFAAKNIEMRGGISVTVSSESALGVFGEVYGNGNMTLTRNVRGDESYNVLGSPFTATASSELSADFLYAYDGSSYSVPTGNLVPGQGYFVAYSATSPSLTLTGFPNSGDVTVAVTTSGDGYNLLSNPYTAPIDRLDFIFGNTSVLDGNIWLWDDGGSNVGGDRGGDYIMINNLGVVSTVGLRDGVAGEKGAAAFTGKMGTMQGFLVNATNNGNVNFDPSMISLGSGDNQDEGFFRTVSNEYQILKLSLSGLSGYNELIVGLCEGATEGIDFALDGPKYTTNEAFSFYTLLDGEPFASQALPKLSSTAFEVELGIELEQKGLYLLEVLERRNFPKDVTITLIDVQSGQAFDLLAKDALQLELESGVHSNRFKLRFDFAQPLALENNLLSTFLVEGDKSHLKLRSQEISDGLVAIHTLAGELIFEDHIRFRDGEAIIHPHLETETLYVIRLGDASTKFLLHK